MIDSKFKSKKNFKKRFKKIKKTLKKGGVSPDKRKKDKKEKKSILKTMSKQRKHSPLRKTKKVSFTKTVKIPQLKKDSDIMSRAILMADIQLKHKLSKDEYVEVNEKFENEKKMGPKKPFPNGRVPRKHSF